MTDITYVRVSERGGDLSNFYAVLTSEAGPFMEDKDPDMWVSDVVSLDVPASKRARVLGQLCAEIPVVWLGTVTQGIWVVGLLAGEPGPDDEGGQQ